MIFNLGNWLERWQPASADTSTFLFGVVKWVTGAVGLALLGLAAYQRSQGHTAIVTICLGLICVVAFVSLFVRDARANRREANQIEERWASVSDPPHEPW